MLLFGYTQPPLPDEGTAAHIFQLSIVALIPIGFLFLTTSDWTQPVRTVRRLAFPAAAVVLAFAALYYLEHYFYPAPPLSSTQRNETLIRQLPSQRLAYFPTTCSQNISFWNT